MRKEKVVSGLSSLSILVLSVVNLLARDRMYPEAEMSVFFFANDIVNIVVAAVFICLILIVKIPRGLFIGIDAALAYLALPLLLIYGLSPVSSVPAAVVIASVYGIIDGLKIEEVLVKEKAPIKREHAAYISVSAVFCVLFIIRAAGILSGKEADAGERITSIADLVLVALWLVLTAIAIVNADKRVAALTGIMTSGAVLEFGLILFLVLDAVSRRDGGAIADIAVVAVMSLVFIVPSYRLLRRT